MAIVDAPWTPQQVAALERWQLAGHVHPFTCVAVAHPDKTVNLVPFPEGWRCPECGYTQTWAYSYMLDGPPPVPSFLSTS